MHEPVSDPMKLPKLKPITASDYAYADFEKSVAAKVASLTGPLFTTDAPDLGKKYLSGIRFDQQHYNCRCCLQFIEKYGNLARLDSHGNLVSALWDGPFPLFFDMSTTLMRVEVMTAKITGVFINEEATWGKPATGIWTHLSGRSSMLVHDGKLRTAHQVEAEKGQEYIMLQHALAEYGIEIARQAVIVLEADALDRSTKTLGIVKWFLQAHTIIEGVKGQRRNNFVWLMVATAPPGWCHVRSSMIGTLLDDIKTGMNFDEVKKRWDAKMHPLQYMRPTAPPKEGAIKQANEVLAKLEAAGAMNRRFAKLEDVSAFWEPRTVVKIPPNSAMSSVAGDGFFDHLLATKPVTSMKLPTKIMTWVKFAAEVLPNAYSIEMHAPPVGSYFGMVTACDPNAPPILQWDGEPRNPVSWFFFHPSSPAYRWGLTGGIWVKVNTICKRPCHWYGAYDREKQAAYFILDKAKLTQYQTGGMFFPESLRSEFHGVRSVMEAYAQRTLVQGREEGTANGYAIGEATTKDNAVKLRVNGNDEYLIDRWD